MKKVLFLVFIFAFFLMSCKRTKLVKMSREAIRLHWVKTYANDDPEKGRLGLIWALAATGAQLENEQALRIEGNYIRIETRQLGYSQKALTSLLALHREIKKSEEYRQKKAIDLGRYVCLLIGSSAHYYALTEQHTDLEALKANYSIQKRNAYINRSSISHVHRKLYYSNQKAGKNQLFLTAEIDPRTKQVLEYESIELMENGQLRFGIFDPQGKRIEAADSRVTGAGKPAKCIWCHESRIQYLFKKQSNLSAYMSHDELQGLLHKSIDDFQAMKTQRADRALPDYTEHQDHTYTELLYIAFMEPSAERLSEEWGIPLKKVKQILAGLPVHEHEEFKELGRLYDRNQVELLAPYKTLAVSGSVRELTNHEVNYLH